MGITYAKEILTNKTKRKAYDHYLLLKKNMDAPKESFVVVMIGLSLVAYLIAHVWRTQQYQHIKQSLAKNKDIKKWLEARCGKKMSRREQIKARKAGKSDDEDQFSDEQVTEALKATYPEDACPEWQGKPTYQSTAQAI